MTISIKALFIALVAKHCLCQCLNWLTPSFYLANNRVLQGHVFQMKTVSSAVICGRECSMDPQCASFNYHVTSKICELNNQTRSESQQAFIEKQGSTYFDNNSETSFYSVPFAAKYPSCQMLLRAGMSESGIYAIYPSGMAKGLYVYCDMETDGGGWIVFQRRQDGSVNFYTNWAYYQAGFGFLSGEFWRGNEVLRVLTETGQWQLRVDLEDWEGNKAWAEYGEFSITGQNYTLNVGSYNPLSTAGDALQYHNTYQFSTWDKDNDAYLYNCAQGFEGAWWFTACFPHGTHLNGKHGYLRCQSCNIDGLGIQWLPWVGHNPYSLAKSEMKMRNVP